MKVGMKVMANTSSGATCYCTVLSSIGTNDPLGHDYGNWLLRSPSHGYAIVRHHTEFNKDGTYRKEDDQPSLF